jgi:hypothetical protein
MVCNLKLVEDSVIFLLSRNQISPFQYHYGSLITWTRFTSCILVASVPLGIVASRDWDGIAWLQTGYRLFTNWFPGNNVVTDDYQTVTEGYQSEAIDNGAFLGPEAPHDLWRPKT